MVVDRFTAEEQLLLDELVHLLIGVVGTVLLSGLVTGRITQVGIIATGIVAGILIVLAFVVEQALKDRLAAAQECDCISCRGGE